jgi:hypothetical protein
MGARRRSPSSALSVAIALRRARDIAIHLSAVFTVGVSTEEFVRGTDRAKHLLGELADGIPRLRTAMQACDDALGSIAPDESKLAERLLEAERQLEATVSLWTRHNQQHPPIETLEEAHAAVSAILDTLPQTRQPLSGSEAAWLRRQLDGLGKGGA